MTVVVEGAPFPAEVRFKLEIVMVRTNSEGDMFDITAEVTNRDTGTITRISQLHHAWGPDIVEFPDATQTLVLANRIRDALREIIEHEINESIIVNGVRVFDPHREG